MLFKSLSGKSFMKRFFYLTLLSLVFSCLSISPAQADELAKLLPLDGAYEDYFGRSVSIDGEYAVVGAHYDDDNGYQSGSAYIFKRGGTAWLQQAKLTASDAYENDYFGWSVSIDGDYAIVGARYDDDNGSDSGSAYIFKRDGEAWSQQAKLTASDGYSNDNFGISVSIDGEYAVIGAHFDDDNGSASGSAYIFKRDGTTWSQQAKLKASDGYSSDWLGYNVSVDGEYAVVGAHGDDDNGSSSGSAYIFKRDGTTWSQQAKLLASDGAYRDYFGAGVSIDGEYAIAGAWGDADNGSNSGSAYIFKRDGTAWSQQAKLKASDGAYDDLFGDSVSINGEYAIVGAWRDDDNGLNSGSAYIFERDGTAWSQQAKLLASDGYSGDLFGFSVSIDGEYAIVGAWGDDDNGANSGSAYIFEVFKAEPVIEVALDIKPHTCPNRLNINSNGLLTVAVLGTEDFDVYDIDPASVELNGVSATRSSYEDMLTSAPSCSCEGIVGPDGFIDLVLKFRIQEILDTLGTVYDGDEFELSLTGFLDDVSETSIEGTDCVLITVPGKEEEISVPDIVGLPLAEAETVITEADLRVGTVTEDYSDTVTAGNVISQDPASGELLPPGGYVDLVISLGPLIDEIVWVSISEAGFTGQMSKYETTNAQYCEFLNAAFASGDIYVSNNIVYGDDGSNGGSDYVGQVYYNLAGSGYNYDGATNGGAARINWTGSSFTVDSGFDNHPVTYVSWYGSTAFASYYGWRLPTEWEWQAVADHTEADPYTYGCGTSINNGIANYYGSIHPDGTTLVGSFGTYGYGMCDMAGNVLEWTNSCYYIGDVCNRVLRGGDWFSCGSDCTVLRWCCTLPHHTSYRIGFRACR